MLGNSINEEVFHIKKKLVITGIFALAALTACQNNGNQMAQDRLYEKSGNTINVNDQRADIYNRNNGSTNKSEDFGYVRHQRSPVLGENVSNDHYEIIDREKTADTISKFCTEVPNVDDVSTLVTDQEVLIVYATDTNDRNATADQVKKMAMSVVPSWYKIYVSDDTALRQTVESYATLDSDSRTAHHGIDKIINQMKKSPQGK